MVTTYDPAHLPSWRIPRLARMLRGGAVVACPAEGVWGLSCNPFDESAVRLLLALKDRPQSKGLIVVAADPQVFQGLLEPLAELDRHRILKSWPGPNTWVVPNADTFPAWITGDSPEVAIRVTSAPPLIRLCRAFGGALVSTSANPAGLPAPHCVWQVRRYFGPSLPLMPGGLDPNGKASTIRRVDDDAVLRP